MMIDNYPGDEEYLNVLHNRLKHSTVAGIPFTSYSLGLKGSDVSNEELFIYNLQNLAIPSTNAYNVTSMNDVNARLEDMAEWIIQRGFSYNLKITIPGTTNGTIVRFTLDNVNSADESKMYIEGTFNLPKRSFDNVSYVGLTSSSGSTVTGVQDGIFVTFHFKDLLFESAPFGQSYIKQWNYASTGGWKENSTELVTNLTRDRSAVVLLNLDCSSSLSNQFTYLQKHACSFVANLCDAVGTAVTLNKTGIRLSTGNSETLTATVRPNNVNSRNIEWTSSDTSVASVDNGIVTGVGAGTATITASYRHSWLGGRYILDLNAQCIVNVGIAVEKVTLNKSLITLGEGGTETLIATVSPDNASDKSVVWTSSNTKVASVNENGRITAEGWGYATITVTTNDGGKSAECSVVVPNCGDYVCVDLGLSVKWAACNVGATKPEEKGDYFAWGEIATKSSYEDSNYKWHNTEGKYTKYCLSNYSYLWGGTGNPDNITVLNLADDVAHSKWYGTWRMPTYDEWKELIDNCSWVYTTINGVKGEKVTSKKPGFTDKWIFLPAAGLRYYDLLYHSTIGYYWSSSLSTDSPSYAASCIKFDSDGIEMDKGMRRNGLSVRPVSE